MATEPNYLQEADTAEAVIRKRLLAKVTAGVDKNQGSYVWDSLSPVAIELVFVGMAIRKALALGFAQTTDIDHLSMRAEEHGVYRKDATYATGTIHVTGQAGSTVPAGLRLATEADADLDIPSVFFVTTETATLDENGEADIPIRATEPGIQGDVAAGSIVVLAQSRKNVYSLTNPQETTGGTDKEGLESLLARYLEHVRNPGTSGNKADYKQWALSVNGVGDAHCIPLWNGEGTVKVVILGDDKKPASSDIVDAVQEFINVNAGTGDRKAPIGATVTVVPASTVTLDISASVLIDKDAGESISSIREHFVAALEEYLKKLAFKTSTIRYARIGSILLEQAGVVDYFYLTINGEEENIALGEDEVAIAGTVKFYAAQ